MKKISREELGTLVRAARSGREADFTALVRATERDLFRFLVFLTGNRALAQDIAQDTYIKVIENLSQLREDTGFSSWLLRTAKNLYLDHLRSPRNSAHENWEDLTHLSVDSSGREAMRELQDLLQPLGPDDRYGLLLVYLEGYSYAEAADRLGITEDALRSRLHRLRSQIGGSK